jgi:hypothetical protein
MAIVKRTSPKIGVYYIDKNTGKRVSFSKYKISVIKKKNKFKK